MEFIHSLSDGKKAVIYDDGNNVMLLFITNIRNMQSVVLARDYLSLLDCLYFRNNIYIAYVSTANELKWKQAGREEGLVLMSGNGEAFDISKLCLFVINEKIYVSYQFYNSSQSAYEIRYINPNGDRKFKVMLSTKERINDYVINEENDETFLKINLSENDKYDYYKMTVDGQETISLSKEYLVDEEENKKTGEQFRQEIEKLKEELKKQHESEMKSMEENYTRQYNELSDMTRQVQEEGRKYRELYVQTLEVLNRKTVQKVNEAQKEENKKSEKKQEEKPEETKEKKGAENDGK